MQRSALKAKKIQVKKGEGLWLLSFTDLCMILISFFILQLSYSRIDQQKMERINEGLKPGRTESNLHELQERLHQEITKKNLNANVKVRLDADGLAVELKDNILFTPGSAFYSPMSQQTLKSITDLIADIPTKYRLTFEGHTDDTPIRGGEFKSNWELSAARGIALLNHFSSKGVAQHRMAVRALADTQPKISTRSLTGPALQNARNANRRVVIRIE